MNPFVRKLRHGVLLTEGDLAVLAGVIEPTHRVGRGDIMRDGAEPRSVVLIIEGWACRYKQLENGMRQITSVLLPGDLCQPFGALPPRMDYSLTALTSVLLAHVPLQAIRTAAQASARIEQALWWDLLLSDALHREHVVSLGRRSATERLGHFCCEMLFRLGMVGLVEQSSCDMPLTQADLADIFGLSAVQVNRSLQELRRGGFLSLQNRRLTVHDVQALRELSLFEPQHLALATAPIEQSLE